MREVLVQLQMHKGMQGEEILMIMATCLNADSALFFFVFRYRYTKYMYCFRSMTSELSNARSAKWSSQRRISGFCTYFVSKTYKKSIVLTRVVMDIGLYAREIVYRTSI